MLLIILFILLLVWGILCFNIDGFDVASPSVFNSIIWAFVALVAVIHLSVWNYDISFFTFSLVVLSCLMFSFGATFSSKVVKNRNYNTINNDNLIFNSNLLRNVLVVLTLLGFLLLFFNILEKGGILRSIGQSFSSDNFLFYLRHKEVYGYKGKYNAILGLMINFLQGVSVYIISIVVRGLFRKDFRINSKVFFWFVLSQIPILGCDFLSTGRDGFVRYFTIILICFLCYMKKYSHNYKEIIRNGSKYLIRSFVGIVVVFLFAGLFTGKTSEGGFGIILSKYISGALLAFDKSIVTSSVTKAAADSFRSFYGLQYFLNRFFGIGTLASSRADQFINVSPSLSTNIYTSFYDYYYDFGYIGTIVIYIIFGLICGYFYGKTKTAKYEFWIPFYAYYVYALVRQITEAFFLKMAFTENHLVMMFSVILCYSILKGKIFVDPLNQR